MGPLAAAAYSALLATAWLAFLTAELGVFRATPCLLGGLVVGGAVAWRRRREPREGRGSLAQRAIVLAMALGGLTLTLPSSELLLGGWDPGVYLHTAAALDRGGSIRIHDPDFANLPDVVKPVLCRTLGGVWEPFAGMRLLEDGRLSPSFHHLYPCLLAVAWKGFGLAGALAVNQALYVFSILVMYAFARRLLGGWWAVAASLLLALNPTQIWQAGFCTSEMLTQLLFLGGFTLLASVLSARESRAGDAILAGASFGLALLARYDTIMVFVPMIVLLLMSWRLLPSRRNAALMIAVMLALLVHVLLHQRLVAPFYHPLPGLVRKAVLWVAVPGGLAVILAHAGWGRLGPWLTARANVFRVAAAVLLVGWAGFMWWIRPQLPHDAALSETVRACLARARLASFFPLLAGPEAANMTYLSRIFGGAGLGLGLAGLAALIIRPRAAWQRFWLFPSLAVMCVLVTNIYNDHFMMWVTRRYMPVVLPMLTLGIVAAAAAAHDGTRRLRPAWAPWIGALVVAAALVSRAPQVATVASIRDWPGLTAWYEELAQKIPEHAIVYCDQQNYGAPLRFLHGRHAFELQARHDQRRRWLGRLLYRHAAMGAEVLLLSCDGPIEGEGCTFDPIYEHPLRTHTLMYQRVGFPRGTKERGCDFVLYRVRAHPVHRSGER